MDTDGDGLTNVEEVDTYHTSPIFADTDADGLEDGAEVNANTNPTDPEDPHTNGGISGFEGVSMLMTMPVLIWLRKNSRRR